MEYEKLISGSRRHVTSVGEKRTIVEELASDRSRIIYSSSFRRLQRKAQVFPLENNSAVRTRLTHSLEVSDIGRIIAQHIVYKHGLVNDPELKVAFIYAVENACLIHDIGNPPFGHFGEKAIRVWFEKKWEKSIKKAIEVKGIEDFKIKSLPDFIRFDGNPQGLRLVTRLQRERDEFGMNLTYTTLLSSIKYVASSLNVDGKGLKKKPGYFVSEEDIVSEAKKTLGIKDWVRFPLAYIMEAADDISYCISDIEDGIEKQIITPKEFFQNLLEEWKNCGQNVEFPGTRNINLSPPSRLDVFLFKTAFTRNLAKRAAEKYVNNHEKIMQGEIDTLFSLEDIETISLKCLKKVSRKNLFRSREAENPELAGYTIIFGLLSYFEPLLSVKKEVFQLLAKKEFDLLVDQEEDKDKFDLHIRLANRLPGKHLKAYFDQVEKENIDDSTEWSLRAHLIIDFIAGMTDNFALETYQLLHGIRIT